MLLAVSIVSGLAAATPALSPETEALVAKVAASVAEVRARHAALPPPKDDAERLVRIGELDQAPRRIVTRLDFSRIAEAERPAALARISEVVDAVDAENLQAVLTMVPAEGWFLNSRYGEAAAGAAFHVVQHADADQWRRFLPVLEPLAAKGEVSGENVAKMADRLAVSEGRPQRYGTQFAATTPSGDPIPCRTPPRSTPCGPRSA